LLLLVLVAACAGNFKTLEQSKAERKSPLPVVIGVYRVLGAVEALSKSAHPQAGSGRTPPNPRRESNELAKQQGAAPLLFFSFFLKFDIDLVVRGTRKDRWVRNRLCCSGQVQ
jgi:hypothetical protein